MALHWKAKTGRRSTIVLIMSLLLVVGVIGAAGAAPAPKVDVCHYDADMDTFHLINISENAFQAHIDHGDASPFEPVPGMPGYEFDAECGMYSTMVADGAFSRSGLDIGFTVYEAYDGTISGTASYSYTGNGNMMSSTISDACLDDVALTATVWGPGHSSLWGDGFMVYTLADDGGSMSLRALFFDDESDGLASFNYQCPSVDTRAHGGTGFLTFW